MGQGGSKKPDPHGTGYLVANASQKKHKESKPRVVKIQATATQKIVPQDEEHSGNTQFITLTASEERNRSALRYRNDNNSVQTKRLARATIVDPSVDGSDVLDSREFRRTCRTKRITTLQGHKSMRQSMAAVSVSTIDLVRAIGIVE